MSHDAAAETEEAEGSPEIDFATYAAIESILAEGGGPLSLLLAEQGITDAGAYASARAGFEAMRAGSASAEDGFQRMREHFVAEYRREQEEREVERSRLAAEQRAASARAAAALPIEPAPLVEEPPPAPERPRNKLQGTALAVEVPRGPALPFAAAPLVAPPAPPPPLAPPSSEAPAPRPAVSGTSLAVEIPKVLPLPFSAQRASESAPAVTPAVAPPVAPAVAPAVAPVGVKRPPARIAGTLPLGAGPLPLPSMPFRPGEGRSPLATPSPAPAPRPQPGLGETWAVDEDVARKPITPFAKAPAPQTPLVTPTAEARAPQVTLEQHASLCAELALYPAQEQAIFQRYGVDAAGKRALDDRYRAVVQQSPEARLAWNRTFQAYSSWLTKQH